MKLRELAARLDRVQRSRRFKIIATGIVVALIVGVVGTLFVMATREGAEQKIIAAAQSAAAKRPKGADYLSSGPIVVARDIAQSMLFSIATRDGIPNVLVPFGVIALISLTIIWLGLGLSYLGLLILGMAVAWPLVMMPATRGLGQIALGLVPLTLSFLVLMQLLRVVFSAATPTFAVARNLLSEAVRMKISLVFIVLLIFFLALIPGMLNEDQFLRYRVQQWMRYGTEFPYAFLALLTVFLSAATVAFEQRDRIIWQTMTKPVASWRYLLGKWLGVMGLNAVLLGVTAAGVFMFTEYLRHQPARGEMAYHLLEDGQTVTLGNPDMMTDDRRILENQVLIARVGAFPEPYILTPAKLDRAVARQIREEQRPASDRPALERDMKQHWQEELDKARDRKINDIRSQNPQYDPTPADLRKFEMETISQWQLIYSTVEPGGGREYEFLLPEIQKSWSRTRDHYKGLISDDVDKRIKEENIQFPADQTQARTMRERLEEQVFFEWQQAGKLPAMPELTLRFKINAGTNVPTELYTLTFFASGEEISTRQVALKNTQLLSIPVAAIENDGVLRLGVFSDQTNPKAFTFPPDGLEILYPYSGYEANFVRVFLVMWLKLGFIAAVAISASTFLSFPVACLVALCVLFAAESASFLNQSLSDYYFSKDRDGNIDWFAVLIRAIAVPVGWTFDLYSELKPTSKLVDGRLISWLSLLKAIGVIGIWSFVAWAIGWLVFRQRELALYSGK